MRGPDRRATAAARRPPSTLSLLGQVRHLAEVKRGWFQQVFLGEDVPDLYNRSADEDAGFNNAGQAGPAQAFHAFERECAASRQVVAQAPSLDVPSKQASQRTGQPWSLRKTAAMRAVLARRSGLYAPMARTSAPWQWRQRID